MQVASKGAYFRKPKVSLILSIKFFFFFCSLIFTCRHVVIQPVCVGPHSAVHIKTHTCTSSSGSVHEQLLLCGAWRSDGAQLPHTPRENALLLLQPHHQQGQTLRTASFEYLNHVRINWIWILIQCSSGSFSVLWETFFFVLIPTFLFIFQAVYFLYGTKDCLVQECKDLDKRIEVQSSRSCDEASCWFCLHLCTSWRESNRISQCFHCLWYSRMKITNLFVKFYTRFYIISVLASECKLAFVVHYFTAFYIKFLDWNCMFVNCFICN